MPMHTRRSVLGFVAASFVAPAVLSTEPASASGTLTFGQYADQWTMINQAQPSTSYWAYDRDRAKVGLEYGSTPVWRSVFRIDVAQLAGALIDDAAFAITLDHTPTGSPTPVDLWTTEAIDPGSPVTWDNFAGSWLSRVGTAFGSAWTAGGQPDQELRFSGLAAVVQRTVDKQERYVTLGLRAPEETSKTQWKKFYAETARLVVTYQR
ncbi:hypothetical protein [Kribbella monticola]|uniref:hypothetical protein n=1 Tax=Kribbella monticola TaxID=2185285 RepID=UPI0013008DA4|nr:hypothetical protein [Kribbella monticola]